MYECPNCTLEQAHKIYTCMDCGHVVEEYEPDGAQMAHDIMEIDEIDKLVKHVDRTREGE